MSLAPAGAAATSAAHQTQGEGIVKRRTWIVGLVVAAAIGAVSMLPVNDLSAAGKKRVTATLNGLQEDPSVSTAAHGTFEAYIDDDAGVVDFVLVYEGLESNAFMSHIHFGSHDHNGGVSVWLCGPQAPAERATCPVRSGTVAGTFGPGNVVGPAGQGISAGELDELIAAIRAGHTYVNVHTQTFPGGEIRGQINNQAQREETR
jgi:hypothetical protein